MNMEQLKKKSYFLTYKFIICDSDADANPNLFYCGSKRNILLTLIRILNRRKTLKTVKALK